MENANKTTQTLTCEAKPSDSKVGKLWEVVPIVSGLSANDVYYPADVLKEHYNRINWANSYLYALEDGSFEHLPEDFYLKQDRDYIGNLVGWLEDPRIETSGDKTKVIANWYIHKAAKSVREFLLDCWEHGKKITLSVTALVDSSKRVFNGKMVDWVNDIYFVSADPVSFPAVKGAEVQALLASDTDETGTGNPKGDFLMDTKLKEAIKSLVKDIAPEADIPEGDKFDQSQAVALLSQTMETLDIESFPEETLKKKLGRARKEIENNNFDSAFEILKRITSETESGPDSDYAPADSDSIPEPSTTADSPTVSDKDNSTDAANESENVPSLKQRLITQFGKVKAEELLELFGDDAYKVLLRLENDQLESLSTLFSKSTETEPDCKEEMIANFGEDTSKALFNALGKDACNCLPDRSPKIEQDDYMSKLGTVYELLDARDTDAALQLLSALLAGNYGYPYTSPYPSPEEGSFFDKLGDVYELADAKDISSAMTLLSALLEGEYGYPSEQEETPPEEELPSPPEELPAPEETTSPEELPTPEEITAEINKQLQAFEEQHGFDEKGDDSMKKDNDADYRKAESDSSGSPDSMKKDNNDSKESAENRITRIELEKLLESSVLPEPAAKKILNQFEGQEATRDEMVDAIQTELEYLESLDVKPQERLKTEAEKTSEKLENELKKLRKKQEAELEKIKAESKAALSELKRQKKVSATKEVLNQLLEDSGLNSVSEQKIRKKFEGEVASKKEIEKAIDEEMDLTAEIINEIASTVTGFGKLETESTDNANSIIHDWFGKQFSIPKSDN